MLVLRKGDEIIGIVDETTGRTVQLAGDEMEALEQTLSAQISFNSKNGASFEGQLVEAFAHVGAVKNGESYTVTLPNGKEVTTIVDLWDKAVGGIVEAKNVKYLTNSSQLRAQIEMAEKLEQPYNLVIAPGTKLSKPLEAAIKQVAGRFGGGIYRFDPATGMMSDY
ncbi:hypothetical protein K6M89_21960 [Rhizobium sp. 13T]|uniref:Tox-REase-7 domain-containing protein n=2 Tax=Rhizobium croatiense TaxID=2867516 RepID=A0ABS7M4A3_9HYPH|nr:hypothetical protein [Rhizobium croatiense]